MRNGRRRSLTLCPRISKKPPPPTESKHRKVQLHVTLQPQHQPVPAFALSIGMRGSALHDR